MLTTEAMDTLARDLSKEFARGIIDRDESNRRATELTAEWREFLEDEYSTSELSADARRAIYNHAWQEGHSSGYHEVASVYQDIATIVLIAVTDC